MSDIATLQSKQPIRVVSSPSTFSVLVRLLWRDRAAMLGLVLVSLWIVLALWGPLISLRDPNDQDLSMALLPPVWETGGVPAYPLGTDHLGRDILTRIIYGARTSLVIGLASVGLSIIVGSIAGIAAGEWKGWVDDILMRLADIQLAIPFILVGSTVLALFGHSTLNMIFVLLLFGWVIFARMVRSEVLSLREMEFIQAARALGARRPRIILYHLLPNVSGQIIVIGTLELANVIIFESALSFLGLGIRPPDVSWGTMLADGRDHLTVAWWVATLPGVAITLTILGVNLLGDWARDMLDPQFKSRLEL
jgi:peptide/nickel transport system permease protein